MTRNTTASITSHRDRDPLAFGSLLSRSNGKGQDHIDNNLAERLH